jgi:hypothetical protein
MVSVGYDNSIRVWDNQSGELKVVSIFEDKNAKSEKESQINSFAWSP